MLSLTTLGAVVAASIAGSGHCVGMCGPIVAFYSGADTSKQSQPLLRHAAYNLGRLLVYAALGALAGLAGSAIDLAGEYAGIKETAATLAALGMLAWGIVAFSQALGSRVMHIGVPAFLRSAQLRFFAAMRSVPPARRAFFLGLLTAMLPCGWLYAFLVAAAGTASPIAGALVLAAFWAGTVPWLAGVGIGVGALSLRFRRELPFVTATLMLVLGVIGIFHRVTVPTLEGAATMHVDSHGALERTHGDGELPPCCRNKGAAE